jgi:glucose/arabinose dehydrogenase
MRIYADDESRLTAVLALAALLALSAPPAAGQGLALTTVEQATGLVLPVALSHAGDGSGRLFIVQQTGEIVIWDGAQVLAPPFLDLSAQVTCCGEAGLLGLAFHPDYAANGELFVDYTRTEGGQLQTVVSRFTVSAGDPDAADAGSEEVLLVIDQPAGNHNGGQLAFGPDGHLHVATGDGGGGGDPNENAQALETLLGKVLRLDVDSPPDPGLAYAVPPDNPFAGVAGARGEIWSYGLRNPWRFSFDRRTGDLWIADVGQNTWEEVDFQPAASGGGVNYGWDCREGAHPFADPNGDMNADCPEGGFTDPVLEYAQGGGRCSVTGGYRYRGVDEPRLRGVYLYGDFCTGEIFGTVPSCGGAFTSRELLDAPFNVTAFGEDEAGEVYVTEYRGGNPPPATSKLHLLALAPGSDGPDLAPSPDPLDFGTVEAGDTVTAVLTVTNANPGPEALSVASAPLSDPGRFVLDRHGGASPCRTLAPCLAPGASCTLGVSFHPGATGAVDETVTFDGNFVSEIVHLIADVIPCSTSQDLTLADHMIDAPESYHACDTLTAGPNVTVTANGTLDLCGGTRVTLANGFSVAAGGGLTVGTDC